MKKVVQKLRRLKKFTFWHDDFERTTPLEELKKSIKENGLYFQNDSNETYECYKVEKPKNSLEEISLEEAWSIYDSDKLIKIRRIEDV